ncbi:DNA polymerase lambda [Ceratocystis fimbriata CBS 114723]|uniref:DNA polymerase lambda n=1 Tax=Ceratocystis fimbriata CBS 114723 TaxID=1035309 RepID=A0A2C5X4U5_9PEZI|nr:DNA polymerase lambda [Ceratocystis fimbriata CBS 114723]
MQQDHHISKAAFFRDLDLLRGKPLQQYLDDNDSDEHSDPGLSARKASRAFLSRATAKAYSQPKRRRDEARDLENEAYVDEEVSMIPETILEGGNVTEVLCDRPVLVEITQVPTKGLVGNAVQSKDVGKTPAGLQESQALEPTISGPGHTGKALDGVFTAKRRKTKAVKPSDTTVQKRQQHEVKILDNPVSEADCFFSRLTMYFVPNDDIAPTRRARIAKVKQYGAQWVRQIHEAMYVVVDKSLQWSDVERFLVGMRPTALIVNEAYTVDCVRFRRLLNPKQVQYRVPGHEASFKPGAIDPKKSDGICDDPPSKAEPSCAAMPQPQAKTKDSNLIVTPGLMRPPLPQLEPKAPKDPSGKDDQLSSYIEMLQNYKDLPLDLEASDDDTKSTIAPTDAASDMGASDVESDTDSGSDSRSRRRRHLDSRPQQKKIAFEHRFACHQGGLQGTKTSGPNGRIIEVLQQMCDYYTQTNDHWRITAYRKAIRTLERCEKPIRTASEASRLPNIGPRLALKVEEIACTDKLQRLEYARDNPLTEVFTLFKGVYGSGTIQAQRWIAQGLRTLNDLMESGRLTRNQKLGVEHYTDLNLRIPRCEMTALVSYVQRALTEIDPDAQALVGGSYRRGADSSHDIDFLLTKPGSANIEEVAPLMKMLVEKLEKEGFLVAALAASSKTSSSKWHGCCVLPEEVAKEVYPDRENIDSGGYKPVWRRIDFLLVPDSEIGAAMLYFTGNDIFNRSMRLLASKKGMRLNQHGLWKNVIRGPQRKRVTQGELVEAHDERRIFEILKIQWREPHERWC